MSITKNKSNLVSIGLYLESNEIEILKKAAQQEGRSLSSYVRRLFFAEGCITTACKKAQKPISKKQRKAA
jgi:hypothetical protein